MPKVTVILPVYNGQKYVHECLDSLISQSFPDWEAICVNDGSTDQTLSILQAYATKDPRIYVIDKPNSGYGDSVNRGIDAARGKYVTILESDDLLPQLRIGGNVFLRSR